MPPFQLYRRSYPSLCADLLPAAVFHLLSMCITLTSAGWSSPWNCLSALDFLRPHFQDAQGDLELSGQGICCNENGSPEFCTNWRGQKQRSGQSSERAFILGYPLAFYGMESEATSKCWDKAWWKICNESPFQKSPNKRFDSDPKSRLPILTFQFAIQFLPCRIYNFPNKKGQFCCIWCWPQDVTSHPKR